MTDGFEMMHKAWSSIEEVPYCFWRSSVKFKGHTWQIIADIDPNWAFPDSNTNLNSSMALKWCTKLEVAWKRCPIVFQSHPSNFKVTRDRKSPILTRIEHFQTVIPVRINRWFWKDTKNWSSTKKVPHCFSRSSIKFQGHTGWQIYDWKF